MTNDEVRVAAVLAFHRFCAERGILPAGLGENAKEIAFDMFVAGADWGIRRAIEIGRKEHEETMRLLLQEGKA
jgi:hypothetical protein